MENLQQLWEKIVERLDEKFPAEVKELWLSPVKLFHKDGVNYVLQVPNKFFKNWIEQNCISEIIAKLGEAQALTPGEINIEFTELQELAVSQSEAKKELTSEATPASEAEEPAFEFNPKLIFSRFIRGKSNQFAASGAEAVSNSPGATYNPLFIWGGVGLGKTHLLHAIGNQIKHKYPKMKALYVQTETFINDFIDSIRFDKPASFRNKYRSVDCLLIDDIQFLVGKQSCQEEFFYTFNAIYDSKKQIVLTSDKPPKDIEGLEERLISRFAWGLVVPIDTPDLETRIAILRAKAAEERVFVPEDIILYLASEIKTNIRVLEGALTKVVAMSALLGSPLTLDTAQKILSDLIRHERQTKPLTLSRIQEVVADHYNLKVSDLKSKKRTEMVSLPRQVAMYLSRELTSDSHASIGDAFGGKDHSTVIHAINKIKELVAKDPFFLAEINKIIKKINYS